MGEGWCVFRRLRYVALGLTVISACAWHAKAQQPSPAVKSKGCRDDIAAGDGYKFRTTRIEARYLPADLVTPPKPGTDYSPQIVTDLQEAIQTALKAQDPPTVNGAIEGFKYISSCVVVPLDCSMCVDVTIRTTALRFDLDNPWRSLLDLPRSNSSTFFNNVPKPLLALNPKFGVINDKAFGISPELRISADLLNLKAEAKENKDRLDVTASGRKSLTDPFYQSAATLSFSHSLAEPLEKVSLEASFTGDHVPLGGGHHLRNAFKIGGSVELRPNSGALGYLSLTGKYRWSRNRFDPAGVGLAERSSENAFEVRAIADGHLGAGVTRIGLWADGGKPNNRPDSYGRVAAIFGYQREFLLKPNQSIGLEVLVGGGHLWGVAPQYARFYGGNSGAGFLYEENTSRLIDDFPTGPVLRSFGSGQAVARGGTLVSRGGTSYGHANFNVTIPIPKWSRPLLPDISIPGPKRDANGKIVLDEDGDPVLEDVPLRNKVKGLGSLIKQNLKKKYEEAGMSVAEATAKSSSDMKDIDSLLAFIAEQANIFAVKPLFMFDAARIHTPNALNNRTQFGVGGGLQFTIVTAKFEAGYMRTVRLLPGDSKGNFVLRLFFQNLF